MSGQQFPDQMESFNFRLNTYKYFSCLPGRTVLLADYRRGGQLLDLMRTVSISIQNCMRVDTAAVRAGYKSEIGLHSILTDSPPQGWPGTVPPKRGLSAGDRKTFSLMSEGQILGDEGAHEDASEL
ncbi:MAG: hypothetical protein K0S45_4344 [Nitrospira sp.]|jgi:hypothetical protein|nr:hypothetical protein [Nitrospira sp.]